MPDPSRWRHRCGCWQDIPDTTCMAGAIHLIGSFCGGWGAGFRRGHTLSAAGTRYLETREKRASVVSSSWRRRWARSSSIAPGS